MSAPRNLVLASGSRYRRTLLERLGLSFQVDSPDVDETPHSGEPPKALALRLAHAKAATVAARHPEALVIGSDQVAVLGDRVLGKPGDRETNVQQLLAASGRRVDFLTALCLLDARSQRSQIEVVPYAVTFRPLERSRVERYVDRDRAFDCAGGFRSESLGPALFERMEGEDPTALMGLPLIRLVAMLEAQGVDILDASPATDSAQA